MTVSFTQPHDPYVSRREYWDLYRDEDIDPPRVPSIAVDQMDEHSRSLYYHYSLNKFEVTETIYRRARRGYYAMISDIDNKIDQLLRTLTECGLDDNTLVIFTSDHGDMIGERGLWFKKNLFDPAIRVPMMMRWPGKINQSRIPTPVSLLDVLPTLLDAAGLSESLLTTSIEGGSMLPLCQQSSADRTVYAEHLDGGTRAPRVMLRRGDLKMVHSLVYPTQLYDMANDPLELKNLAHHADWSITTKDLLAELESIWNLPVLEQEVISNQKVRQLLSRSLGKGEKRNWEYYPNPHATSSRWVREGDYFPEVEHRGYLSYPEE